MEQETIFYYYPFSCSTATHIILEESGLVYQRTLVDLSTEEHKDAEYLSVNPKGAVPALLDGNGLLTENQAILTYIADQVPHKNLLPPVGDPERYRAHEWMNFCATKLHTYSRAIFRPSAYSDTNDEAALHDIRAHGVSMIQAACPLVESKLDSREWAVGQHFGVVDAYLFIMYLWSRDSRMGASIPACPNWKALAKRVSERVSGKTILEIELAARPDYHLPNLESL